MTLLVTVLAASFFTFKWYSSEKDDMKLGSLCLILWGASLMWTVDAVFEFAELGADYFTPAPADMLNDLFLGLTAVALAIVIWLVILLVKDPRGKVAGRLLKQKN